MSLMALGLQQDRVFACQLSEDNQETLKTKL